MLDEVQTTDSVRSLSKETIEKLRQKAQNDLFFFAKGILGFAELNKTVHRPLCRMLEAYEQNTRLAIVMPRGWFKTTVCSQAYPLWRAIRDPSIKILLVQNTFGNAVTKLRVIDQTVRSNELFRTLFPELLPDASCVWRTDAMSLKRPATNLAESTFEAAGTRTQSISRHYDLIIEDDTSSPDLADMTDMNIIPSSEDISKAIGWHRQATSLTVDILKSQILVVSTRWYERDLISWIWDNEDYFKTYEIKVRRTDGVVAWPERFSEEVLDRLKKSLGPYMFSCLYLNTPVRSGDMVFRREWFKFYDTEPQSRRLMVYTTVDIGGDPNDSKTSDTDYSAVVTTGKDLNDGKIYVLEVSRGRWSVGELINEIMTHVRVFHPIKVGVESVGLQKILLYCLRERMRADNVYFMLEGITHGRTSKESRIRGLQPLISNGAIVFRPRMNDLLMEFETFPMGSHDDMIDALAMQSAMWASTKVKSEIVSNDTLYDPMSLDEAIEELEQRNDRRISDPLDDVLHSENAYVFN
jgi:predicted phage terminase large subunit-like protein